MDQSTVQQAIGEAYSEKARKGASQDYADKVAQAFGYTKEDLESIPLGSNLGLSCGNPVASATLKEGEVVLDLGCGGGLDIFLAASKVGLSGKSIGIDMSPDMIALARRNASNQGLKPPRVAFVQASLSGPDPLPIESDSVDCILSNCVLNLLPPEGKRFIIQEVWRLLRPGGRVVLSDIIAKKPFPEEIVNDVKWYVGCVSGAIQLGEYEDLLEGAGFTDRLFVDTKSDLSVYYLQKNASGCCSNSRQAVEEGIIPRNPQLDINEWAGSYHIYARKGGDPSVPRPQSVLKNWWDAYPLVKSSPESLSDEEVVALIRSPDYGTENFAVIDVRRNDHAGGHVRGSHNWHAQTYWDDLPTFYDQFKDVKKVIFYCNRSNGRGPRSAGWYQDYLDSKGGEQQSRAYVLHGGIKNWLEKYEAQEELVDRD